MAKLRSFLHDDVGASLVEYAITLLVAVMVGSGTLVAIGGSVADNIGNAQDVVAAGSGGASGSSGSSGSQVAGSGSDPGTTTTTDTTTATDTTGSGSSGSGGWSGRRRRD